MNLKSKLFGKPKLTASVAAAAVALSLGGYAIADATSTSGAAATAANSAQVIPFQPGQQGASKTVGQVPASFSAGTGTIV
ncbi:MAG: hypothetical protein QOJ71_2981, partial [Actinomycetota bacterium]|nr:hypothetical protein [Actinomycetota bacterium]